MQMLKIENPQEFRKKVQEKINTVFQNPMFSFNLEKGIYNFSIHEAKRLKVVKKWTNHLFVVIYVNRFKSVFINLQHSNVLEQVQKGEILPHTLAFMTHQEWFPQKWEKMIQEKKNFWKVSAIKQK